MKNFSLTSFAVRVSVFAVAAALSACGGGGGGSSSTTPPVSNTCSNGANNYPTCNAVALQTSVAIPSYAASADQLVTFNELNAARKAMGLGLLAQNTKLDTAAQSHANYLVANKVFTHYEVSTNPSFTGVNPSDRTAFAGYGPGNGMEVVSLTAAPNAIRILMNSVYHRDACFDQNNTEVGIGFNSNWVAPTVLEFGANLMQSNASNFITTYPVDGQTNLPLTMVAEKPNPIPSISDFTTIGSPISFYSAAGTTLTVNSFTVTLAGLSTPLPVTLLTAANDPVKYLQSNVAHIIASSPFTANTSYTVNFSGSVNGVPVNKTWSFKTGTSLNVGGGILGQ